MVILVYIKANHPQKNQKKNKQKKNENKKQKQSEEKKGKDTLNLIKGVGMCMYLLTWGR